MLTEEKQVRDWLQHCVIELGLCPFAQQPSQQRRVCFVVIAGSEPGQLLAELDSQCSQLLDCTAEEWETTLLILSTGLRDFFDFNDFIGDAERHLTMAGFEQNLQIAGFHPRYQFAGEPADDASNYSNRAPYPILQLLRQDSISWAAAQTDTAAIPQRNIEKLRAMGAMQLLQRFPWVSSWS